MRTSTFNIIAVEDDADDRILLDEAFKEIGYEAEIKKVANGDLLLDYLGKISRKLYPSLVILDNSLPNTTALEVLQHLKANAGYAHIPVVIYTTLVSPQVKEELLTAGALACLQKKSGMQAMIDDAKWFKEIAETQAGQQQPNL